MLAVSGVVGDEHTYYFGGVGGGVWKTTDGGLSWHPLTDKVKGMSPSIGAIAVAPSDPNVIYAGTGEACIRGDIIDGNGVYKSIDAGKTWTYTGLRETRAIGRLAVNPKNPDVAFVAALGHPFGSNPERGIYRTTDGGKNWAKVLYQDEKSGGIDLSIDPSNPNVVFASLWQADAHPGVWTAEARAADFIAAATEAPHGNTSPAMDYRMELWAVSEWPPLIAIESGRWSKLKKAGSSALTTGGDSWTLTNSDRQYRQRAFYYTHVFADPRNPDGVYVICNTGMYRSNDGGKSFRPIRVPHGDNHRALD